VPVSLIRCSIRLSRSYGLLGATAAMTDLHVS
jgi:hypothetical protein